MSVLYSSKLSNAIEKFGEPNNRISHVAENQKSRASRFDIPLPLSTTDDQLDRLYRIVGPFHYKLSPSATPDHFLERSYTIFQYNKHIFSKILALGKKSPGQTKHVLYVGANFNKEIKHAIKHGPSNTKFYSLVVSGDEVRSYCDYDLPKERFELIDYSTLENYPAQFFDLTFSVHSVYDLSRSDVKSILSKTKHQRFLAISFLTPRAYTNLPEKNQFDLKFTYSPPTLTENASLVMARSSYSITYVNEPTFHRDISIYGLSDLDHNGYYSLGSLKDHRNYARIDTVEGHSRLCVYWVNYITHREKFVHNIPYESSIVSATIDSRRYHFCAKLINHISAFSFKNCSSKNFLESACAFYCIKNQAQGNEISEDYATQIFLGVLLGYQKRQQLGQKYADLVKDFTSYQAKVESNKHFTWKDDIASFLKLLKYLITLPVLLVSYPLKIFRKLTEFLNRPHSELQEIVDSVEYSKDHSFIHNSCAILDFCSRASSINHERTLVLRGRPSLDSSYLNDQPPDRSDVFQSYLKRHFNADNYRKNKFFRNLRISAIIDTKPKLSYFFDSKAFAEDDTVTRDFGGKIYSDEIYFSALSRLSNRDKFYYSTPSRCEAHSPPLEIILPSPANRNVSVANANVDSTPPSNQSLSPAHFINQFLNIISPESTKEPANLPGRIGAAVSLSETMPNTLDNSTNHSVFHLKNNQLTPVNIVAADDARTKVLASVNEFLKDQIYSATDNVVDVRKEDRQCFDELTQFKRTLDTVDFTSFNHNKRLTYINGVWGAGKTVYMTELFNPASDAYTVAFKNVCGDTKFALRKLHGDTTELLCETFAVFRQHLHSFNGTLFIDEAPAIRLGWLLYLIINCNASKIVMFGDLRQCLSYSKNFPLQHTFPDFPLPLTLYTLNVTLRMRGPVFDLCNALNGKRYSTISRNQPSKIFIRRSLPRNADVVLFMQRSSANAVNELVPSCTWASSQGISKDIVAIVFDKFADQNFLNFRDSTNVAFSRAKSELHIVIKNIEFSKSTIKTFLDYHSIDYDWQAFSGEVTEDLKDF
jgi:hypothetical protein